MNTETEQVLQAALALREDERDELVEALLSAKNDSTEPLFNSVMLEDFRRRSAEIDSGAVQAVPWNEARERVRRRLQERSSG